MPVYARDLQDLRATCSMDSNIYPGLGPRASIFLLALLAEASYPRVLLGTKVCMFTMDDDSFVDICASIAYKAGH